MTPGKPKSILFVCTGNTCRSPMAEIMFRSMLQGTDRRPLALASRGVAALDGAPLSEPALQALRSAGFDGSGHRASALAPDDVSAHDVILVMERFQVQLLTQRYPGARGKTFLLTEYVGQKPPADIEDPIGGSPSDYEKCRIELQDCLLDLLAKCDPPEGSRKP